MGGSCALASKFKVDLWAGKAAAKLCFSQQVTIFYRLNYRLLIAIQRILGDSLFMAGLGKQGLKWSKHTRVKVIGARRVSGRL